MKISKDVRDKLIEILAAKTSDCYDMMSSSDLQEMMYDLAIHGQIGYNDYTCDELIEQFETLHELDEDCEEWDVDADTLAIFKEAKAQVDLHNTIANQEVPF